MQDISKFSSQSKQLVAACSSDDVILFKKLIQAGANVNATNIEGDTILHIAVKLCNKDAIELLLNYGANVNVKNKSGETPLCIASHNAARGPANPHLLKMGDLFISTKGEIFTELPKETVDKRSDYKKIVKILLDHGASLWPIASAKYRYVPLRYKPLSILISLFQTALFVLGIIVAITVCIFIDKL